MALLDIANDYQMSTSLDAFLMSETTMIVITRDAEQVKLVRRLFKPRHRRQIHQGSRWHVWALHNYTDVPVVKHAITAYKKQLRFA